MNTFKTLVNGLKYWVSTRKIGYEQLPEDIARTTDVIKTVNGNDPDETGNLTIYIPTHSWDTLENKPFYKEVERSEFLNVTYPMPQADGDTAAALSMYRAPILASPPPKNIEIIFDEVSYICETVEAGFFDAVGNLSLVERVAAKPYKYDQATWPNEWPDTGEPFLFMYGRNGRWMHFYSETAGDHSFEINLFNETIHTLDPEFIPDTIARTTDVTKTVNSATVNMVKTVNGVAADEAGNVNTFNIKRNHIILTDIVNGYDYIVQMYNGNIVSYCMLSHIEVTTMPTKLTYVDGEPFDATGMTVTAIYQNGESKIIDDYVVTINSYGDVVMVSYIENGITCTVNVDITVIPLNPSEYLVDFEYTDNTDGTYTITGWKGTLNGVSSTEMIIPNNSKIIV